MPSRHTVTTLRKSAMISLARNWDYICYGVHSPREMADLLETDKFLDFEGPFGDVPSTILEDLMDVIRSIRSLSRKFLHLLFREQLLKLNLSSGVGEIYYGLQFLPRCKRLREINLSYLQHVDNSHLMPIVPHLGNLTSLDLSMTCANDNLLRRVAQYCPNLIDINIQNTFITDDGLGSLCGLKGACGESQVSGCLNLQRLLVADTRITWLGAYEVVQNLPYLTDFDFDKIFQVFEHLDPSAVLKTGRQHTLRLRTFYSTTPAVRGDSIDSAAALCPKAEFLSLSGSWIDNETFYKFMQFECLKTLSLFNSEGKTIDYAEGVLPVLQVCGPNLENLILSKFAEVDLISLGKSCPKLKKLAMSEILKVHANPAEEGERLFDKLTNVELWLGDEASFSSQPALLQLLQNSLNLENILVKKSNSLDLNLLRKIWMKNPMRRLSRLMLDHCNAITGAAILELLTMENDLNVIRIWSCAKITEADQRSMKQFIRNNNYLVYVEWFE